MHPYQYSPPTPPCKHDYTLFNASVCRFLNRRISLLYLNFFNVVDSNTFEIHLLGYHMTRPIESIPQFY